MLILIPFVPFPFIPLEHVAFTMLNLPNIHNIKKNNTINDLDFFTYLC